MNKFVFGLSLLLVLFTGCKTDAPETKSDLSSLEQEVRTNPTSGNLTAYFQQTSDFVRENKEDKAGVEKALQNAADIALKSNQPSYCISYLMAILRSFPENQNRQENLKNLALLMNKSKQEHAAKILYKGYMDEFADAPGINELSDLVPSSFVRADEYVDSIFQTVFTDPDEYGLNRKNALKFVDAVEAFALVKPNSGKTPDYLYKASEVARSIRTLPKALSIYDWLLENYPEHKKTPTILFLKGFVLENELKNIDAAKEVYEGFINKYPDNELASSVKFLLENIGKSDEEILDFIEKGNPKEEK